MKPSRAVWIATVAAIWLVAQPLGHAQATPASEPPRQSSPAAAAPPSARVDAQTVRNALARWGCAPLDLLSLGERWFAACGAEGVFVVAEAADQTLALLERRSAAGSAAQLFARDGAVWVESVHRDARPLSDLPGYSPGGPLAAQAPDPAAVATSTPSLQTVTDSRSAPSSNGTTSNPTDSTVAPSRIGDLLTVEAGARPFLPLKSQKFALLAEFAASYYGARPWYVQARILPLGLAVGSERNVVLFGGSVVAGYDQQYFSVGVGIGAARRGGLVSHNDNGVASERFEQSLRFSVTQAARLGAQDGLHLSAQSSFVLLTDRWALAFFELKGQVPINRETWLAPAGGGGRQTGFFYVEMGLRRLLRGDRGHGSLFVRPSVGMAAVDARTADSAWHPGPMVGVHLEWRP